MFHGIYAITTGVMGRTGTASHPSDFVEAILNAWRGGARAVQIRAKDGDDEWFRQVAGDLLNRGYGRPVNSTSCHFGSDERRICSTQWDSSGGDLADVGSDRTGAERKLLLLNGACVQAWPWHLVLPDGLHLGAGNATEARRHLAEAAGCGALSLPWIWSAHSVEEARAAFDSGASAVTISPIYPTDSHPDQPAGGLGLLRSTVDACPGRCVIALGGIGPGRVAPCRGAGASAVAMIGAVFCQDDVEQAARSLVAEWDGAIRSSDSPEFK